MDGGLPASQASALPLEELEAQITELAGHLNAAQYRWLTLIAQFDRRLGWSGAGMASCAHWLNFKCGLNLGAAREKIRVAHALVELPKIAAAMARGELSYSKVRALTRVACPATEENLLMIALHGTAHHVESIVRLYRRAQQAEQLSREARQQAERSVSYWYDEDGSLVLKARLPALGGAMLVKALEAAIEAVPAAELCVELAEEQPLSFQARRADAMVLVGESYLQQRSRSSRTRRGEGTDRCHTADRYQVVVHVDAQTLEERTAGRCHLEHGPQVPAETARRLSCDSSLVQIVETEQGVPLDVGRKTRSIPPAIRRALNARDTGCRFPGCTYQRRLDAHHIEHWADGGETKLTISSCCAAGITVWSMRAALSSSRVQQGGGAFSGPTAASWTRSTRRRRRLTRGATCRVAHDAQGIRIDSRTAVTRWCGESIDYELGVWGLCQQKERARRACAGADGAGAGAGTAMPATALLVTLAIPAIASTPADPLDVSAGTSKIRNGRQN